MAEFATLQILLEIATARYSRHRDFALA